MQLGVPCQSYFLNAATYLKIQLQVLQFKKSPSGNIRFISCTIMGPPKSVFLLH